MQNRGLNGFFGSIGRWFKRNAAEIISGVAFAVAGPIGGIISGVLAKWLFSGRSSDDGDYDLPQHIEAQLTAWSSNVYKYLLVQKIKIFNNVTATDVISNSFVDKLNKNLKEVSAVQAYYEFKALSSTGDDKLLYREKGLAVAQLAIVLIDTQKELLNGGSNPFEKRSTSFNPKQFNRVGPINLNWNGVQDITASSPIMVLKSTSSNTNTTNPRPGNTNTTNPNPDNTGGGDTRPEINTPKPTGDIDTTLLDQEEDIILISPPVLYNGNNPNTTNTEEYQTGVSEENNNTQNQTGNGYKKINPLVWGGIGLAAILFFRRSK